MKTKEIMETILKDLQEARKKLGEKASKEIEKRYVGKGAVILTETHKFDIMVEKTYTICKPYKICPSNLSFRSNKKIDIAIFTYPNTNKFAVSYLHLNNNEKKNSPRISYNDTIEFTSKTTTDAILKELRSLIKEDEQVNLTNKTENGDYRFLLINYPIPTPLLEDYVIIPFSQLTDIIKKDLEDYLNEGL